MNRIFKASVLGTILFLLIAAFSVCVVYACCDGTATEKENGKEAVKVKNNQTPPTEIEGVGIQYDVEMGSINNVDVRVIPVTGNGETHDYVVAVSLFYKAGGIGIEHFAGCRCFKEKKNELDF